jgi:multiple sugar transport system ATP-binding protein
MIMSFLNIDNVIKHYQDVEVLKSINIQISKGDFLVLVGPSGCGKSTLLNMIAGLDEITDGEISINGREMKGVHPSKRDIAMVFQSYALYPNMTVEKNISFGLELLLPGRQLQVLWCRHAALPGGGFWRTGV